MLTQVIFPRLFLRRDHTPVNTSGVLSLFAGFSKTCNGMTWHEASHGATSLTVPEAAQDFDMGGVTNPATDLGPKIWLLFYWPKITCSKLQLTSWNCNRPIAGLEHDWHLFEKCSKTAPWRCGSVLLSSWDGGKQERSHK